MKRLFAFILILALGLTMISCGSTGNNNNEQTGDGTDTGIDTEEELPFELSDLVFSVEHMVKFLEMNDMTELDADNVPLRYGIVGKYTEAHAIVSATIASDECVIFKANDESAAAQIVELLKTYRDERIELYNGYAPEETPRLESAFIDAQGCYVVFAATVDPDQAKAIWLSLPGALEARNAAE